MKSQGEADERLGAKETSIAPRAIRTEYVSGAIIVNETARGWGDDKTQVRPREGGREEIYTSVGAPQVRGQRESKRKWKYAVPGRIDTSILYVKRKAQPASKRDKEWGLPKL